MRYLGIDYGKKNIGIALTDNALRVAFPHSTIKNKGADYAAGEIKKICEKNEVARIVLGKSVNYKNEDNPVAGEAGGFKRLLEKTLNIPVLYQSEILTTKEAGRIQGKKEGIHASAAALILRSYLERKNVV